MNSTKKIILLFIFCVIVPLGLIFALYYGYNYFCSVRTSLQEAVKRFPIVYRSDYNIGFLWIEKLHPFDSRKWGKVFSLLQEDGIIRGIEDIHTPEIVSDKILNEYLEKTYLESLNDSQKVSRIVEMPLSWLPNFLLHYSILKPMRFQTGGTILATKLALKHKWAINIGGGFHHASCKGGGGFCAYPDIYIAVKEARKEKSDLKVLIIDMDAHQGNGHEKDFINDKQTKILDIYNKNIYPFLLESNPVTKRIDFRFLRLILVK